jgi:agmatine deiminase
MHYNVTIKIVSIISLLILFTGSIMAGTVVKETNDFQIGLPRVREGGTPYDPNQSLYPYVLEINQKKDMPLSGLIESPAEYEPIHGVLYSFSSYYQASLVTELVAELTKEDQFDEIAYVCVSSASQQTTAETMFTSAGANMSKVEFIVVPMNSIWIRDYGPHFIWQNNTLGLSDSHYYQTRQFDNFVPTLLGDEYYDIPTWDMRLYHSGGNFLGGPNQSGFVSSLVNLDNPPAEGFDDDLIMEIFQSYKGIDELHIMPQLPFSVDGTGHIDMWMNIVDEETVIISEFKPGSNPTAITITNNAVTYMEDLGFQVFRTPAWNVGSTHFTYTNAYRVNDRYFIPSYPSYPSDDAEAIASFQDAAGSNVEIIAIDCSGIIGAAGAIHCIVKQVPRKIDPFPSVHVLSPDGGEIFVGGTIQRITWGATDTYNKKCEQIDLYYSTDGGVTYTFIDSTSDTGFYDWLIPDLYSDQMKIKLVATAEDLSQAIAESNGFFTIAPGTRVVYDFSNGAGVDKFAFGYQTLNWNSHIDGVRMPVNTEIDTLVTNAYDKIAFSDSTGGNNDENRYISPTPSSGRESTHVVEFTIYEDPTDIDAIDVYWEGYANRCTQMELYIWDVIEEQWCNGIDLYGQNRYMDNWAGNQDGYLETQITDDIHRFIDDDSKITLLAYAKRSQDTSFHDYVSVTISQIQTGPILVIDPSSFDFGMVYENETVTTSFEIWNAGSGLLNYTIEESCDWLTLSSMSGNLTSEIDGIEVIVNTTGLSHGSYHCDIIILSEFGNELFEVDLVIVAEGTALIDVDQGEFDRGFRLMPGWDGYQEFVPSMDVLSSIELFMTKSGSPTGVVTVQIRSDDADGALLFETTISPGDVSVSFPDYGWVSVDVGGVPVNSGETYVIVLLSPEEGAGTHHNLQWAWCDSYPTGSGGPYLDGWFYFRKDFSGSWSFVRDWDFSFRTYGY